LQPLQRRVRIPKMAARRGVLGHARRACNAIGRWTPTGAPAKARKGAALFRRGTLQSQGA
jgi:hypothetical protein